MFVGHKVLCAVDDRLGVLRQAAPEALGNEVGCSYLINVFPGSLHSSAVSGLGMAVLMTDARAVLETAPFNLSSRAPETAGLPFWFNLPALAVYHLRNQSSTPLTEARHLVMSV